MKLTLGQALQEGIKAHQAGKVQEADMYYTAVLKADPKNPNANHNMGVLAVGLGKVERALPFFKSALELDQSIPQFWVSYIEALIKLKRMEDARVAFDQAKTKITKYDEFGKIELKLATVPRAGSPSREPPKEQLQNLINLYTQSQYNDAVIEGSQLLEQFPTSANLFNIVGTANQRLGELKKAVEAYEKALAIKPDFADVYFNMGNALRKLGKLNEAIESYSKALVIKPSYSQVYNNMGNVLKENGELEEATKAFSKALSIKPDDSVAFINMGVVLHEQGKLKEALQAFGKALAINPDSVEAYMNMGLAFKEQRKFQEAMKAFNKAIAIEPNVAEAYYQLGMIFKKQGNFDEAIKAYTEALSLNSDHESTKHMLAALTASTSETAPRKYVEKLFDGFSKDFEDTLVEKLEYKTPELIKNIIIEHKGDVSLGSILDLGCGTGLFGTEIRNNCALLDGIDLSKNMLRIAKDKNIYDNLIHCDIIEYLSSKPLAYDYYVALDVFVYLGNLTEIFRLIKSRSKAPGNFVFSTEHTELEDYHILKSGRYSHSKSYIQNLCNEFDYNLAHFSIVDLRKENGQFLTGGIYILNF